MARLIWLTGPSGSGKDSLLDALRAAPPPRLLIAHRYITRAADAGGENHVALTEAEFARRAALGLFAVSWQAHGFSYGIGCETEQWLLRGQNVVVNGSRLHLAQAQARFGSQLLPVCLQVSPEVLRSRLQSRGRESEKEIAQRLERAARYTPADCHILNNDGSLLQSVDNVLSLIRQKEKQHA